MHFRPFQNSDSAALCEIWRAHATMRGKFQGIRPAIWEQMVFSKPYFDPQGLILAFDQQQPLGFVHASFGRSENEQGLDRTKGIISQLMVLESEQSEGIAAGLLQQAEIYFQKHHVKSIVVGGHFPSAPFYLGLYGGSRAVGILTEDQRSKDWFVAANYVEEDQILVRHWHLNDFRPLIDRQQMMIGRSFIIEAQLDPVPTKWCDACNFGMSSRTGFTLKDRKTSQPVGTLVYWDMEPLVKNWGVNGMGLVELWVQPELRQKGVAKYMVGESLRQLKQHGVALVEIQHLEKDPAMTSLCNRLGFQTIDAVSTFVKLI